MKAAGIASPALGTRAALLPRHLARKSSMSAGGIRAASRKHDGHDQSSQQVCCRFGVSHCWLVHFGDADSTGQCVYLYQHGAAAAAVVMKRRLIRSDYHNVCMLCDACMPCA